MSKDLQSRGLFHKGHYNIIAARIKEQLTLQYAARSLSASRALHQLALAFAKRLKEDNERFDPIKFLNACSPDVDQYPLAELWYEED